MYAQSSHPACLPGLYVVERIFPRKSIGKHVGILDVGNRLGLALPVTGRAVVVHLTPEGIRCDWEDESGEWKIIRKIEDEIGARMRLHRASANPHYSLLGNNCEHFVNSVANGDRKSPQIVEGLFVGGLAALGIYAFLKNSKAA